MRDLAEGAGDDPLQHRRPARHRKTVIAAQKGLTLPVMQRLDAEVELEGKDPAEVAAAYLERVGLTD